MKCATCVATDRRSTVTSSGGFTTLMGWSPYYDEDGQYHSHDPNTHSASFHCSNGHDWQTSARPECEQEDYP